jgi:hypothetical protein
LISKKTNMVLSLTLAGLALLYLLFPSSWLTPSENYQMRVASGLLLFFYICITLWSLTRPRLTSSEFNLGFASIGLLVVFSLPQFVHNYSTHRHSRIKQSCNRSSHVITCDKFTLNLFIGKLMSTTFYNNLMHVHECT